MTDDAPLLFERQRLLAEAERERLWRDCARDNDLRALELEACRRDVVRFVRNWVWTFDPRSMATDKFMPFLPFPKQVGLLRFLEEREATKTSGVVCKGRDTGVTWLCVAFAVHRWVFHEGYVTTFGSRRENLVDRLGDMDAILPKARYILSRLPVWLLPRRYDVNRHSQVMMITNPDTKAVIKGESGDEMGRGGRSSLFFIDETAKVERLSNVFAAVSATTDVEVDVSTPGRPGDPFDQRCDRPDVWPLFELDWRDDPRKTREWAVRRRAELGPMIFAREYERDRKISMEGLVIQPAWAQAGLRLRELVDIEPSAFVVAGGDIGGGGRGKSVFIARAGPVVRAPIDWNDANTTMTAFRLVEEAAKVGAKILNYDPIGIGAGVTGALKGFNTKDLKINGINVGLPCDKRRKWPDGKTSAEKFQNVRAELWWILRDRLMKTWEHVMWLEGDREIGAEHPLEDLLALPDDPSLIAQLSQLTWWPTTSGKIQIEAKTDLRSRGIPSPDLADALMLTMTEGSTLGREIPRISPISYERQSPFAELG
jgi:hypothetical protein